MRVVRPYSTELIEFYFYFPKDGKFQIYPANVSQDGIVFAHAPEKCFEVKKER